MADVTAQASPVFEDGRCDHTALFSVKNTTAGDTLNVGNWFSAVKRAGLVSATGTTIANCTFTGTTLTIPAGPNGDGVWVIVVGVAV
jgi:hypothetical protein